MFNEWYENKHVPRKILNALWKEAVEIDKEQSYKFDWLIRKGVDSEMGFAMALGHIITEHEYATQVKDNNPQIPK